MTTFTNFLFVPASKPERYEKAMGSGADLICIDLEDSVPAAAKDSAREDAIDALKWLDLSKTAVRINGIRTAEGLADLLALRASDKKPCLLFIPMVEHAVEIEIAKSALGVGTGGFVPLIETVRGLSNAIEIAAADGKAAIHPSQIAIIKMGMKPTEAEVAEAKDALAAFEAAGGAVIRHKGQMLEVPIVKRYQQILASA